MIIKNFKLFESNDKLPIQISEVERRNKFINNSKKFSHIYTSSIAFTTDKIGIEIIKYIDEWFTIVVGDENEVRYYEADQFDQVKYFLENIEKFEK
jgi:hypothetical protein